MEEILNIEHHRREMTLKALNRTKSAEKAAKLLGVDVRTVRRYNRRYGIVRCPVTRTYQFKNLHK